MSAPVISGAAAITPLGRGLAATADAVGAGRSAIQPVDGLESPAARIGTFTTDPEMPRAKARRMDLGSQYAIAGAYERSGACDTR